MDNTKTLYRIVGRKIREGRERYAQKLSQAALAERLGVSRASIVNIEAGRQHAPLHLLWQIAEVLGVELTMLIPRRDELIPTGAVVELNADLRKVIADHSGGDPEGEKHLTDFVGRLLITLETSTKRETP